MIFKVKIRQTFNAVREITIDVDSDESEGMEGAIEQVASGSIDVPDFDDTRWLTSWNLQGESYGDDESESDA